MTTSRRAVTRGSSSLDEAAFDVLANRRRRAVLRRLGAANGPVAVADLARDVVASERDGDARDVPEDAVEDVYAALHHAHLPKLADAGYLRYDEDRTAVAVTDEAGSLDAILEWAAGRTD